jgi:hypothetical protein
LRVALQPDENNANNEECRPGHSQKPNRCEPNHNLTSRLEQPMDIGSPVAAAVRPCYWPSWQ